LAPTGCEYVGSAALTADLDLHVPAELGELIAGASTPLLREAYRDIAVHRTSRADVFRLGAAPLSPTELSEMLGQLELIALPGAADEALSSFDPEAGDVSRALRVLLDAGVAHPAAAGGASCDSRATALDRLLAEGVGGEGVVRVLAAAGTAVRIATPS
jgi:hypothetical protein